MKSKLAGLLVVVLLLLSTLAGAIAMPIHAVNVKPFSASTPAPDQVLVTGTEAHTWTNIDGSKEHAFYLPHGTYDFTVKKAGYTDFTYRNLVIGDSSAAALNIYYQLTAIPTQDQNQDTGQTGSSGSSNVQSNGIVVKELDFEDEAKPNQEIEFTIELKNTWTGTDGKGIDAREANVNLAIKGIDDGSDVEEDVEFGMIDYKDTESQTVRLTVPVSAEEGTYNVVAKVTWEDKETKTYEAAAITKSLEIERAEHDVAITRAVFESDSLRVDEGSQVAISLANIGTHDELVRVRLQSTALGLSATSPEFKLRESKETTQYLPFTITKDVQSGKYPVTITTILADGTSATQTATLEVEARAAPAQQATEPVSVVPVATTVQETEPIAVAESSTVDSNVAAGFVAVILVLIVFAVIVSTQMRPKPVIIEKRRGK